MNDAIRNPQKCQQTTEQKPYFHLGSEWSRFDGNDGAAGRSQRHGQIFSSASLANKKKSEPGECFHVGAPKI
jgi:hypothetical protein